MSSVALSHPPSTTAAPTRRIGVQHLMAPDSDLLAAQRALDEVGEQIGVRFELRADAGDILMLDDALQARLSPHLICALREDRPLVTLPRAFSTRTAGPRVAEHSTGPAEELLRQCRKIPILGDQRQAETTLDPGLPLLLQRVLQGRQACNTPPLHASYGPMACLQMDFSCGEVVCDVLALEHLRLHSSLPQQVAHATLQPHAVRRGLDETLWDLGVAAAAYPLHNAPANSWHAPVGWVAGASVRRHSRQPMHLEAVRLLRSAALSPSHLRRQLRASERDLRELLQACLLLGAVRWASLDQVEGEA